MTVAARVPLSGAEPMLPWVDGQPVPAGPTPARVADLLEMVSRADRTLEAELDRTAASKNPISQLTVNRLEKLLRELRPAAEIRTQLAALDPDLLHAGMSIWLSRREAHGTATQRAARRWHTGGVR
jgi:hypothetical protein